MGQEIVNRQVRTLEMTDTVATRKYPFTQKTLDQIKDLREDMEDEFFRGTGEAIIVPAPIVIADAVDLMHKQTFNNHEE